ncbi:K Homology domain [Arabidopsis suecica]|uniref:K Homology domain n=1 Tax=Arabidopsis suecica TaxID=45249 RepID=A0A8T2B562_ARASU|nr:K Homology domain [Arabidopsis suecica]
MLAYRTLFRIDRVFGFTSRCFQSKPESFSILSFRGSEKSAMDGFKKQKMVNLVWRPISTQSSSILAEAGNEVQEVAQCSKSSDVSEEDIKGGVNETASVVSAGKHSVSLEVGASLIKFIRGKEGTTHMKLEEEMGVKIILPSSRNEDYISIEGGSVECVTKASERIATIVDEVVRSPSLDYSHFVSLPLAIHPELVDKLVNFQNSILGNHSIASDKLDDQANRATTSVAVDLKANSETNKVNVDIKSIPIVSYPPKAKSKSSTLLDLGIEKSIFIKPSTFHLTVVMLKLWNKDRVNAARDVLKSISPSVMDALDNKPVFIRLKGLDCMRGPLAKTRVLYAPVEEIGDEGRLLRACQVITDAFVKAGLVLEKDAKQSLKLHVTVMNARHRKRRKNNKKKMETFDAREIHEQFGNEDWGEYLIREAHLSQRFMFDQNGYYRCCASLPFPGEQRA